MGFLQHFFECHASCCDAQLRCTGNGSEIPYILPQLAQSEQVLGELIADSDHVHPAMMELLVRLLGPARTIVMTDALPGAGSADASFAFAGYEVHIEDGAARPPDHTLCGSILTMDQAWHNMLGIFWLLFVKDRLLLSRKHDVITFPSIESASSLDNFSISQLLLSPIGGSSRSFASAAFALIDIT